MTTYGTALFWTNEQGYENATRLAFNYIHTTLRVVGNLYCEVDFELETHANAEFLHAVACKQESINVEFEHSTLGKLRGALCNPRVVTSPHTIGPVLAYVETTVTAQLGDLQQASRDKEST